MHTLGSGWIRIGRARWWLRLAEVHLYILSTSIDDGCGCLRRRRGAIHGVIYQIAKGEGNFVQINSRGPYKSGVISNHKVIYFLCSVDLPDR